MKTILLITLIFGINNIIQGRSIHRPEHKFKSEIITNWENETETHNIKNWYLTYTPIFHFFNKEYLEKYKLPDHEITFRNSEESISGDKLSEMIEELITDIKQHKTTFKNFKVLKKEDFNWNEPAGLLVFKFTEYPFVVKVFLETPRSFVKPYTKGWRPGFFFMMGGGINRYLAGFTRITNLNSIKRRIKSSEYWSSLVDTPRKWFYLPKDVRWFEVRGKNLCPGTPFIKLPSAYVIITDMIEGEPLKKVKKYRDQKLGLKLAQYLDNDLDAHIGNFIVEKDTEKLVVIDSEHFRSFTGVSKDARYSSYEKWYLTTVKKASKDIFLYDKYTRRWKKNYMACQGVKLE